MLQLRSAVILLSVLTITVDCTTCYIQNSIPNVFTQICPANVYQCMKFDCRINNPKKFIQSTKGCNDPANPPVSCTTLMTNCQQQGGTGQCYTCTGDYCNSGNPQSVFISILAAVMYYFLF